MLPPPQPFPILLDRKFSKYCISRVPLGLISTIKGLISPDENHLAAGSHICPDEAGLSRTPTQAVFLGHLVSLWAGKGDSGLGSQRVE